LLRLSGGAQKKPDDFMQATDAVLAYNNNLLLLN
jgi:hypothetical protein